MMKTLRNRRVLVLGLGLTGFSLVRHLVRCGATVVAADTRAVPPYADAVRAALPQVRVVCGPLTAALFDGIDMMAISPGVAKDQPLIAAAVARGVELAGDVELFARALPPRQKILAITGTNGKTTTTALTRVLCEAAGLTAVAAGNIGDAVLDVLERFDGGNDNWPDVFVLELSSYQLETTASLAPTAATVLNVSGNHLDRYADIAAYAQAKARIFAHSAQQVLNGDDPCVMAMRVADQPLQVFGTAPVAAAATNWLLQPSAGEPWLWRDATPLLSAAALTLAGRHNALNALAALSLTSCVAAVDARVLAALKAFRGLPHRMEDVGTFAGVRYINDSKATTVAATQAALDGIARPVVLIAGGDGKGQDFAPLAATAARCCRRVLLIGRDAPQISAALKAARVDVEQCGTLERAVGEARRCAQPGDIVLLSPACASLDQFADYTERGRRFAQYVRSASDGGGDRPAEAKR